MSFSEATHSSATMTTSAGALAIFQKIHDALAAVGMVQTSDTGQINLGGSVTPSPNTDVGYEIWRFNDAAQSTDPIFIRLDYGYGTDTNLLRVKLTTGTGSNGSGTIANGHTTLTPQFNGGTPQAGTTARIIASFVNGSLFFTYAAYGSSGIHGGNNLAFLIERLRDPVTFALKAGCIFSYGRDLNTDAWCENGQVRQGGSWSASNAVRAMAPAEIGSSRGIAGFFLPRLQPYAPLRGMLYAKDSTVADNDAGVIAIHGANANYKKIASPYSAQNVKGILSVSLVCTD